MHEVRGMWKAIVIAGMLAGGAAALSSFFVGYDRAGSYYLQQVKEKRKSVRTGSAYYRAGYRGGSMSRGMRGGK